jgi:hypothetical protein
VKNGKIASFWLDPWLESVPLCRSYSVLFELALNKNSSVFEVKERGWVIPFRIRLQGVLRAQWYELATKLNEVVLNEGPDEVSWKWSKNKMFSVKSIYEHLTKDDRGSNHRSIWKTKIPAKIKTFMWLIEQGVILTKDNMVRKNWHGDPTCYFYNSPETIDHLFLNV